MYRFLFQGRTAPLPRFSSPFEKPEETARGGAPSHAPTQVRPQAQPQVAVRHIHVLHRRADDQDRHHEQHLRITEIFVGQEAEGRGEDPPEGT